jgi:hypothetical protein
MLLAIIKKNIFKTISIRKIKLKINTAQDYPEICSNQHLYENWLQVLAGVTGGVSCTHTHTHTKKIKIQMQITSKNISKIFFFKQTKMKN